MAAPGTPSTLATIVPNTLRYLGLEVAARGLDLQPVLAAAGLPPAVLGAEQLRISYRQGTAVVAGAVELTGDPGLGLDVGARQHATAWSTVGLLLMAAPSLVEGTTRAVAYQNLAGAMLRWTARPTEGGMVLRVEAAEDVAEPVRVFLVDEALASALSVCRVLVGRPVVPRQVRLSSAPPPHAARYAALGPRVAFRCPHDELEFAGSWVREPLPGSDPWTWAETVTLLDEALATRREQQELLAALEVAVTADLPRVPPITEQARRLLVSERTLRRRLAEMGTSYEAVVDAVRRDRAERLLARGTLSVLEVARGTGYSDERTLRKAAHRWFGTSPTQWRRERAVR